MSTEDEPPKDEDEPPASVAVAGAHVETEADVEADAVIEAEPKSVSSSVAERKAKETARKKMVTCSRALVTAVTQANKDGLVAPLQQALDDAINAGMPTDCAAAVRARKVLQSLQASERKADVRRGIFLARKHGGNSVESDNEVRMCMGIMLGLCVSRET